MKKLFNGGELSIFCTIEVIGTVLFLWELSDNAHLLSFFQWFVIRVQHGIQMGVWYFLHFLNRQLWDLFTSHQSLPH